MTGAAREPQGGTAVTGAGGAGGASAPAGAPVPAAESVGPEVTALHQQLAERTADVQRVSAEYANYRKRVDRDRTAVVEAATGGVLAALLPILDDVDRARQHDDLTGAFKAVADQLEVVLEKLGLERFGEPGDPFDPTLHEAVMHSTSADVSAPTCVQVLRRGYRHGDRLLRAALVAVAEPDPAAPVSAAPTDRDAPTGPDAPVDWPADDGGSPWTPPRD